MQADESHIHKQRSGQSLNDSDNSGLASGLAQSADPELAADGKRDKAQGRIADQTHAFNKVEGRETQTGHAQSAQNQRAHQNAGHQIAGDIG